jgi:multiple sugar transport system permease protein
LTSTATTVAPRSIRTRRRYSARGIVALSVYVGLIALSLLMAFPLLYAVSTSLKSSDELRQMPPSLIPQVLSWGNYVRVYALQPLAARWVLNTLIVVFFSLPGSVATATLVAYGFARFEFPGRNFWFIVLLSTMMLPSEVTLIPSYLLFHSLGWINTFLPLTVPAWFGGGAFSIFFIRQFFMTLPRELDDAARIDGANTFQILWHVLAPLASPVIMTLVIFGFLSTWNDFFGPLIYLNSRELYTLALGLNEYRTMPETTAAPNDNLLMAGVVYMTIPCIALFVFGQRYFVRGLVMSGLKL